MLGEYALRINQVYLGIGDKACYLDQEIIARLAFPDGTLAPTLPGGINPSFRLDDFLHYRSFLYRICTIRNQRRNLNQALGPRNKLGSL